MDDDRDLAPEDRAMLGLLADHVPLSLLLDLVSLPAGGSEAIYAEEISDLTWLPSPRSA